MTVNDAIPQEVQPLHISANHKGVVILDELVHAYEEFVRLTDGYQNDFTRAAGLAVESAELLDLFHKVNRKNEADDNALAELDTYRVMDELSDVLWFLFAMMNASGLNLKSVMHFNYLKLERRLRDDSLYATGKRSEDRLNYVTDKD